MLGEVVDDHFEGVTTSWRRRASNMCILIVSPGFIRSVSLLGIERVQVGVLGAGPPVGTPFFWMKAELTGSSQLVLHTAKQAVHSRLSMVRAAHQSVSLQLGPSINGGFPGG